MTLIALAGWLATGSAADDGNETMSSGNSGQPLLAAQAVDLTLNPGWEWRMEEANTLYVIRSAEELAARVTGGEGVAAEVDFFSIGTNDLTQYVLAVDRGNRRIAAMYDTLHPAVVRAMRLTVDAAHRHGCEVGICGEFAGCAAHAELLVGLGFDELSVAPPSVPAVKERIRGLETPQAELTARRAVEAATASEVHELIGVG